MIIPFKIPVISGALVVLFALSLPAHAATITDSTFNNADWDDLVLSNSFVAASYSAGQVSGARNTTFTLTSNGSGGFNVGHIFTGASYDPSTQGAINFLDFTYDARYVAGQISGQATRGLLLQNGSYYGTVNPTTHLPRSQSSFTGFSFLGLTESSWFKWTALGGAGGATPDFSATGGVIQFGYNNGNGLGQATTTVVTTAIDNFAVNVDSSTVVPVPAALPLLLTGLSVLGFAGWRRRAR